LVTKHEKAKSDLKSFDPEEEEVIDKMLVDQATNKAEKERIAKKKTQKLL